MRYSYLDKIVRKDEASKHIKNHPVANEGLTMEYKTINYEKRDHSGWIYLNRNEAMNALCGKMLDELEDVLWHVEKEDEIRVLVLTATGKTFCTGADLKEILEGFEKGRGEKDFLDRAQEVFRQLRDFPKPVLAAINGLALAGGLELAMCCDIVIAAQSAEFGDAHSNYGVFPGAGGAALLPRKIGLNRAKYLLFSGEFLPASEIKEWGLINRVVPDAELEARVEEIAQKIATKSPLGLRLMKQVANQSIDQTEHAALMMEHLTLRKYMCSYDIQEGLKAFCEKRKPVFKGI